MDNIPGRRESGQNDDRYAAWRNHEGVTRIGYVHLAFRMIVSALHDYFYGEPEDILSATLFFHGSREQSTYYLWCRVLDQDPDYVTSIIAEYQDKGNMPSKEELAEIERLYLNMVA